MGKIVKKLVVGHGDEPNEYYVSVNRKDIPMLISTKKDNVPRLQIKELHCIDYPNPKYGMKAKITKFNVIQKDGHISKSDFRWSDFTGHYLIDRGFELSKKDLPQADEKFLEYNKTNLLNQKLVDACEKTIHHKK